MNKEDRKEIAKAIGLMEEAKAILDSIKDAEQQKFDNLSEGLQASEMGQKFESNVSDLEDMISNLENDTETLQGL